MQAPDDRHNLPPETQAPDDGQGRPYPAGIRYYYHLPGEDFRVWRRRFKGLADRYRWTDAVTKQFAFAHMRNTATQTVMDIPLYGPETAEELLEAYQDRFYLGEDIENLRLLIARRRVAQACCRRSCCPRYRCRRTRKRSLLKPRVKWGIPPPVRPHPVAGTPTDRAALRTSPQGAEGRPVIDRWDFPRGQ